MFNTALGLGAYLECNTPELILDTGIAGAFEGAGLKPGDIAKILNISLSTVNRLARDGEIRAIRVARSLRFRSKDLEEFLERGN